MRVGKFRVLGLAWVRKGQGPHCHHRVCPTCEASALSLSLSVTLAASKVALWPLRAARWIAPIPASR